MRSLVVFSVILNVVALVTVWPLAWYLRHAFSSWFDDPINSFETYAYAWPIIVVLGIASKLGFGLLQSIQEDTRFQRAVKLFKSILLNGLLVAALGFAIKEFDFGRIVVVLYVVLLGIVLPVVDGIIHRYRNHLRDRGLLHIPLLIVGAGEHGLRALHKIEDTASRYTVLGFVDTENKSDLPAPFLGLLDDLPEIIQQSKAEEVIIAMPSLDTREVMDILLKVEDLPVIVHIVSTVFGVLASNENVEFLGETPVFTLQSTKLKQPLYEFGKRLMDVSVAAVSLLLFLPVFPILVLLIKLDSKGKVFFVQERVGRNGKLFKMYKLRTMSSSSDPYAVAPKDNTDARITKLGGILRKTSLDEVPQLLNVINGTMSLVGPRPEMPFIVDQYELWQRRRLDVLPGITGLWQIVGRKDLPLHENLEYDFYYIRNRSLVFDLVILLRTIPAAVFQRGAY